MNLNIRIGPALPQTTLPLTAGQVSALWAADSSLAYSVSLLEKPAGDRTVGCAVVGEVHAKFTGRQDRIGRNLVREFPRRGVEMADAREQIGGEIEDSLDRKTFSGMIRGMNTFFSPVLAGQSMIHHIQDEHREREIPFIEQLNRLAKEYDLFSKTPEELEDLLIRLDNGAVRGSRIVDWLRSPSTLSISTTLLEANHNPDLHERFSQKALPIFVLLAMVKSVLASTVPNAMEEMFTAWKILNDIHFASLASTLVFQGMPIPLKRALNPIIGGILFGRDVTLARNIDRALIESVDERVLMGAMGMGHADAVASLLERRHGFTRVAIPAPVAKGR